MSIYVLFTAHVVHCLFSESISSIETADSMNSQSIEHDSQEINKRQDIEKKKKIQSMLADWWVQDAMICIQNLGHGKILKI